MSGENESFETILFERSPLAALDAIVQHDGRALYLYLSDNGGPFGTRACWVRNFLPGPLTFVAADLEAGRPPLLPSMFCNHPTGLAPPAPQALRIVWFEEENGVALYEHDQLLAVIPPWSGQEEFHGYARDCLAENKVCWPLPDRPALRQRLERAEQFWRNLNDPQFAAAQLAAWSRETTARFGPSRRSVAAPWRSGFHLTLQEHVSAAGPLWISHGLSLFPQPNVELSVPRPALMRRIELAASPFPSGPLAHESNLLAALRHVAGIPWRTWRWIGARHRCQFVLNSADGTPIPVELELAGVPQYSGGSSPVQVWGDPLNLLRLQPPAE